MDGVAPPAIKLSDAKHHASLLFIFLSKKCLSFGVNEISSFQKLLRNLDKMIVANLGRQHPEIFEILFRELLRIFVYYLCFRIASIIRQLMPFVILMRIRHLDNKTFLCFPSVSY